MYTPLHPTFIIIVKLGITGVYVFLKIIFALKHRLWILIRTVSMRQFERVPTINVLERKKKNIIIFHLKINIFTAVRYRCILHGRVFVMLDDCSIPCATSIVSQFTVDQICPEP